MTFKFSLTTSAGRGFIVRFYPASRARVVRYEPDVLKRCRAHGICVPEVITDSRYGPKAPLEYMVYRRVEGVTLQERIAGLSREAMMRIAHSLVSLLSSMAELEVQGYGELSDAHTAQYDSWVSFVHSSISHGLKTATDNHLLRPEEVDRLTRILEGIERFPRAGDGELAWGDVSLEHIILDATDRIVGLLDFEGVLSADRLLTLGYLRARCLDGRFYHILSDCWTRPMTAADWARVDLYAVLRGMRILGHGQSPLPIGVPRSPLGEFLPGFEEASKGVCAWLEQFRR
jgi:aminoglycoside phosphotransferase (APT) family kinase protein